MIDQNDFKALLAKYLEGRASVEEIRMLESFYLNKQRQDQSAEVLSEDKARQVWHGIDTAISKPQKSLFRKSTIWAAACVIAILTVSLWGVVSNSRLEKSTEKVKVVSTD